MPAPLSSSRIHRHASHRRRGGFSLVEAAVAIAVVAILAGMLTPLFLKTLDQQRDARTRESLRQAFEALFGAKDRRVANLRSDTGFNPTASLADLSILVLKTGSGGTWSGVRNYASDATYGVFWGYNGPYWTGPTSVNRPLDAWGRPMALKVTGVVPNQTWQVYSFGPNGVDNGASGDDLVYPTIPAVARAFTSVLNVTINYTNYQSGAVGAYSRNATGTTMSAQNYFIPPNITGTSPWSWTNQLSPPTLSFNVAPGGMALAVTLSGTTTYYIVDLQPGEIRDFTVTL